MILFVAFVDGFDEFISIANKYGSEHLTNMGIITGIFVMMIGLMLFE